MPHSDPLANQEYKRLWYQRNREKVIARSKISKAEQRKKLREYIREVKDVPCSDCGKRFHYCAMDFDHLGDKETEVGRLVQQPVSLKRLQEEIAKCEVVCANCHRVRTYERNMWT